MRPPRSIDFRWAALLLLAAGVALIYVWAQASGHSLAVMISAGAAWAAAVLFAIALRNVILIARHGRPLVLGPPQAIPDQLAGWLALAAFFFGLFFGRAYWH